MQEPQLKKENKNRPIIIGVIVGISVILISLLLLYLDVPFFDKQTFYFVLGISFAIIGTPFFLGLLIESSREKNIEQMFIEFSRDLVEGVKAGTPINKTIINLRTKDYGSLNSYISKLANQISIGIPVKDAFETFSRDVKSPVISRAVSLIKEAERSGGEIESILESVTFSVNQIEKLKKERAAAVYSLTVQGYIIFFIFIIIMLVLQFKILPITQTLSSGFSGSSLNEVGGVFSFSSNSNSLLINFSTPFLFLLITQGLFAGLIIGKISEGTIRAGYKHSFILVLVSWLISTGATRFIH
jgi:flagellar protein FlaJ